MFSIVQFACIASGITTLWGPAHGGANEAVLNMLEEIGTVDNIPKYIAKAKNKHDPVCWCRDDDTPCPPLSS